MERERDGDTENRKGEQDTYPVTGDDANHRDLCKRANDQSEEVPDVATAAFAP